MVTEVLWEKETNLKDSMHKWICIRVEEWRVTLYGDYRFKANKEYAQIDDRF